MNSFCKTLATIVALVAIVALVVVVVFALCELSKPVENTVELPNVILSLIGVCATLIVGVSIYNIVDVSSVLRNAETKVKVLEEKLAEMEKLADEVKKTKKQTNILYPHTWGMQNENKQPYSALCEFWKAFELCAKSDDYNRGKACIFNANEVAKSIITQKDDINKTDKEKIPHEIPSWLKETKLYEFYRKDIDGLFKIMKVIKCS